MISTGNVLISGKVVSIDVVIISGKVVSIKVVIISLSHIFFPSIRSKPNVQVIQLFLLEL